MRTLKTSIEKFPKRFLNNRVSHPMSLCITTKGLTLNIFIFHAAVRAMRTIKKLAFLQKEKTCRDGMGFEFGRGAYFLFIIIQ
jgi:hypothetical protein